MPNKKAKDRMWAKKAAREAIKRRKREQRIKKKNERKSLT
jgi:hypothetical protein